MSRSSLHFYKQYPGSPPTGRASHYFSARRNHLCDELGPSACTRYRRRAFVCHWCHRRRTISTVWRLPSSLPVPYPRPRSLSTPVRRPVNIQRCVIIDYANLNKFSRVGFGDERLGSPFNCEPENWGPRRLSFLASLFRSIAVQPFSRWLNRNRRFRGDGGRKHERDTPSRSRARRRFQGTREGSRRSASNKQKLRGRILNFERVSRRRGWGGSIARRQTTFVDLQTSPVAAFFLPL